MGAEGGDGRAFVDDVTQASRTITADATVLAPPRQVYDALVDLATWPTLDPTLVGMTPQDPLATGSRGTMTNRRAGLRITTTWEILELVPGARYVCRIVGRGYELVETVDLEARDGGTAVSVVDDLRSTSLTGRVMVPLSGGVIQRDLDRRMVRLKELLESGSSGQPIGQ